MLKVLMLRKKIDDKKKALDALRKKDEEFLKREADLEAAINEADTDEQKADVEALVADYEVDKNSHDEAKGALEREISELEAELAEQEKDNEDPAEEERQEETDPETPEERTVNMNTRDRVFGKMSMAERTALFARDDVKAFLESSREAIKNKRGISNVGLLIPEPLIEVLRANVLEYSKLYKHVNVKAVKGNGLEVIEGPVAEAVWTECCANLNELSLDFNGVEIGCWTVGGYYSVCNATLEDSDIDLAAEILTALGQAIGLALDKAILYGTGTRMPLGVVTRLAETSQPAGYPAYARTWVDLHTTHLLKFNGASMTPIEIFATLIEDSGVVDNAYGRGELVWVMNNKTAKKLIGKSLGVDAAGALVAGVNGTMPGAGGIIETLPFIPDGDVIVGFFDLYLLAERAGDRFAQSEHVQFLQNRTVFKGTARYDGQPAIAEAFAVINIANTNPTTTVQFAPDDANTPQSE